MTHRMLPLLYLNLGGEMMYILDHRLMAQNIGTERGSKVLNDIVSTMFNKKFIHEIFMKHTPLYSRKVLRAMFDRLANASIMRLNQESMDKLYDLMIMAVKYQIWMSPNPRHLIMITLNHLDALTDYATCPATKKNIFTTYELLIQTYCGLSISQLQWIRFAILNFMQDINVRVSILIRNGLQNKDGTFCYGPKAKLPHNVQRPGEILFFDRRGEIMDRSEFQTGVDYEPPDYEGGLGVHETGNRGTNYGLNMYDSEPALRDAALPTSSTEGPPTSPVRNLSVNRFTGSQSRYEVNDVDGGKDVEPEVVTNYGAKSLPQPAQNTATSSNYSLIDPNCKMFRAHGSTINDELAKEELNLLAKLIGTSDASQSNEAFRINLFDNVMTEEVEKREVIVKEEPVTVEIDLRSCGSRLKGAEISRIMGEMTIEGANVYNPNDEDEEDLLNLLENVS